MPQAARARAGSANTSPRRSHVAASATLLCVVSAGPIAGTSNEPRSAPAAVGPPVMVFSSGGASEASDPAHDATWLRDVRLPFVCVQGEQDVQLVTWSCALPRALA